MDIKSITPILEYGGIGLSALLIVALVWAVKYLSDAMKSISTDNTNRENTLTTIIGNHIDHQTISNTELTVAIKELSTVIREKMQ